MELKTLQEKISYAYTRISKLWEKKPDIADALREELETDFNNSETVNNVINKTARELEDNK